MKIKLVGGVIGFVILAIGAVAIFWRQPVGLSLILIFLGWLKHKILPIKREGLWFLIVGILGTTTESLMMWLGNGPWGYAQQTVFNFPLWLVPLWGLAGILLITLYEGLFKKKE
jgi:hypothetical protein